MRNLREQFPRLFRMALSEDEFRALLQRFRGIAFQDLPNLCDRARLVLLHERIERQQLQVFILFRIGQDGLAAPGANLNLQRAALVDPAAPGKVAAQLDAGFKRGLRFSLLVLRIRLPIQSSIGVVAALPGHLGEDADGIGPAPFIDGARSIRVEIAVGRVGRGGAARDSCRHHAFRK